MIQRLVLLVLLLPLFINAEPAIKATVTSEKSKPGVTQVYTVAFSAESSDYSLSLPDKQKKLKGEELPEYIISDIRTDKRAEEGLFYLTVEIDIAYFKPGTYELPEVCITDSEGNQIGYRKPVITVESINKAGTFEDIEAPYLRGGNYTRLIFLTLALLLFAVIVYFIVRMIRNRMEQSSGKEPKVDPAAEFFRSMKKLEKKQYLENEMIEPFCTELSAIFRKYLQLQYGIQAPDMTTDEIYTTLVTFLSLEHSEHIRELMRLWDLAKFAELRPSAAVIRNNIDDLKNLVKTVDAKHAD